MSDGSLSQDEIDQLLSGMDSGPGAAPASKGPTLSDQEKRAFQETIESTAETQSSNLSMMTGKTVSFQAPLVEFVTRDQMLQSIPEEVLAVKADFVQGLTGEHLYLMSKETAVKIASLANKEEGMDLDDMAISAVNECVSTMTGTEINAFSDKTGIAGIQPSNAEGKFVPKAMVQFPLGDFVKVTYNILIGDDRPDKLVEAFSLQFVKDLIQASGGSAAPGSMSGGLDMGSLDSLGGSPAPQQPRQPVPSQGGYPSGGGGMGQQFQQMGGAPQGGFQQMQGYQGGPMGGYQQPQMGGYGGMMSPPNVQSVQFPSLQQQNLGSEQGNIGLIMDVFMELTVELGRTKKLIREILGMGEGTIIELDKLAGEPVDILVNHKLIAKGEVVVIDENFGVRVTEIVSPMERMSEMG